MSQLAWIEVRWRIVLMLCVNGVILSVLLDDAVSAAVWLRRLDAFPMLFATNAIVLAGCGVTTHIANKPSQVVHPAMLYTLSLPITRARLVLVRELVGLLSALAVISATLLMMWIAAPSLRTTLPTAHVVAYVSCVLLVATVASGISAIFSTWLDQLWQTYAALGTVAALVGAAPVTRIWQPALRIDRMFDLQSTVAPLAAVALAAVLSLLSVRIVQRREF